MPQHGSANGPEGPVVDITGQLEKRAANELWRRRREHLAGAIAREVGTDGWDIADYAEGERGQFEAKVYTDWCWAGFLAGTAKEIAAALAEVKAEYLEAVSGLICPSCGHQFVPYDEPGTSCGCGTRLFCPTSRSGHLNGAETAVEMLPDAPPLPQATTMLQLAALACSEPEWRFWAGADAGAFALAQVVPTGVWQQVHGRLYGLLPAEARWEAGQVADLLEVAETLGYRLVVESTLDYSQRKQAGWFERESDGSGMPRRFTLTFNQDGTWTVTAETSRSAPESPTPNDFDSDRWEATLEEADDCWWEDHSGPVDGWEPFIVHEWSDTSDLHVVASATVPSGPLTAAMVERLLRAGAAVADGSSTTLNDLRLAYYDRRS